MEKSFYTRNVGQKEEGFFHHAYFFTGSYEEYSDSLAQFLKEEFDIEKEGNPDFHEYFYDRLYLENATEIKAEESKRSFHENGKKIFCVTFSAIPHEAGNALLKVLEEPSTDTIFFFFASSPERLLPTMRSRLLIADEFEGRVSSEKHEEMRVFCEAFLDSEAPERLKKVKTFVDEKDRQEAMFFLNTLETLMYEKANLSAMSKAEARSFREIESARDYMRDISSSVKLLLEHLSLVLPSQK